MVSDQIGRPTFASDLAAAIVHLLTTGAAPGSYHVTGGGEPASWADVARAVYALAGQGDLRVTDTSTECYGADRPHAARRPLNSVLDYHEGPGGRCRAAGLAGAAGRVRSRAPAELTRALSRAR